jgi:tetratricopeptide repeat protein 21B
VVGENLDTEERKEQFSIPDSFIQTARSICDDLPHGTMRTRIVEGEILLASGDSRNIEQAISLFTDVLNLDPDYIPALYGCAVGHHHLKQTSKVMIFNFQAQNLLKKLAEQPWKGEFAQTLERAWLLHCNLLIQVFLFHLGRQK